LGPGVGLGRVRRSTSPVSTQTRAGRWVADSDVSTDGGGDADRVSGAHTVTSGALTSGALASGVLTSGAGRASARAGGGTSITAAATAKRRSRRGAGGGTPDGDDDETETGAEIPLMGDVWIELFHTIWQIQFYYLLVFYRTFLLSRMADISISTSKLDRLLLIFRIVYFGSNMTCSFDVAW
jgi:hypothetical protein